MASMRTPPLPLLHTAPLVWLAACTCRPLSHPGRQHLLLLCLCSTFALLPPLHNHLDLYLV
jgi:hypothetical protein